MNVPENVTFYPTLEMSVDGNDVKFYVGGSVQEVGVGQNVSLLCGVVVPDTNQRIKFQWFKDVSQYKI